MSETRSSIADSILKAAEDLVRERGADALDMSSLASRAGISRATLYRQCRGRDAVLAALAARGIAAPRRDARRKVLDAAKVVFSRSGFEAATIEQIAARAEVAEATVYRLFKDKEGIVTAFMNEFAPRRAAREALERSTGDLREDLQRFAERLLTVASESQELLRIALIEMLTKGSLVARVRAHSSSRTLASLVAIIEPHERALRAMSAREAAQAFTGMVMGFGLFGPVMHGLPVPEPKETAAKITALFFQGALRSPRKSHAKHRRPPRAARA
ncbi:MAG: helix-turn-helix domain-containing protein [Polyangiales bacterium]